MDVPSVSGQSVEMATLDYPSSPRTPRLSPFGNSLTPFWRSNSTDIGDATGHGLSVVFEDKGTNNGDTDLNCVKEVDRIELHCACEKEGREDQ